MGVLTHDVWDKGVFVKGTRWLSSSLQGQASLEACVLAQVRTAEALLSLWELDKGVVVSFKQWKNVSKEGSAAAEDMVQLITKTGDVFQKVVWENSVQVVNDIVDGAGSVIKKGADAIKDAIKSIGKHLGF